MFGKFSDFPRVNNLAKEARYKIFKIGLWRTMIGAPCLVGLTAFGMSAAERIQLKNIEKIADSCSEEFNLLRGKPDSVPPDYRNLIKQCNEKFKISLKGYEIDEKSNAIRKNFSNFVTLVENTIINTTCQGLSTRLMTAYEGAELKSIAKIYQTLSDECPSSYPVQNAFIENFEEAVRKALAKVLSQDDELISFTASLSELLTYSAIIKADQLQRSEYDQKQLGKETPRKFFRERLEEVVRYSGEMIERRLYGKLVKAWDEWSIFTIPSQAIKEALDKCEAHYVQTRKSFVSEIRKNWEQLTRTPQELELRLERIYSENTHQRKYLLTVDLKNSYEQNLFSVQFWDDWSYYPPTLINIEKDDRVRFKVKNLYESFELYLNVETVNPYANSIYKRTSKTDSFFPINFVTSNEITILDPSEPTNFQPKIKLILTDQPKKTFIRDWGKEPEQPTWLAR